ncbi:Outer membrane efflux protein [Filimonas lacunae]|uniref:Outer membrane efflux protein n=1 Tax=Filimonas lacunae TaxID=477680 RepID=A0A1N7Q5B7_9BACT|nr:Outer membrane efflux protein [Filimonas lacunae]
MLVLSLTAVSAVRGQESMIPDVNYPLLEKLIQTAKTNYPRVKMYGFRMTMADANVKKAKAGWFDILSFSYLYSPNNSTNIVNPSIFNGYQLGLVINFGSILTKAPAIKLAKEEKKFAEAEFAEYQLTIEAQVKQRYYLYVQYMAVVRLRGQSILDMEASLKDTRYRYEKGEATLAEYNTASTGLADQINAKITAEGNLLIAKSSLEEILGKKLEEIN